MYKCKNKLNYLYKGIYLSRLALLSHEELEVKFDLPVQLLFINSSERQLCTNFRFVANTK